jgi:hypothetical protein
MNQQLQRSLEDFSRRFDETPDDFEDFDAEIVKVPDMNLASYERFLGRRAGTTYGRLFSEFRDFATGALLEELAHESAADGKGLVATIAEYPQCRTALWRLMDEYRWRLQKASTAAAPDLLRTLLRLAILDEDDLDEVETANILTAAWGDAEDAGLAPATFFAEAAELAGTRQLTHGQSAREILREFEPLDYGRPRGRKE